MAAILEIWLFWVRCSNTMDSSWSSSACMLLLGAVAYLSRISVMTLAGIPKSRATSLTLYFSIANQNTSYTLQPGGWARSSMKTPTAYQLSFLRKEPLPFFTGRLWAYGFGLPLGLGRLLLEGGIRLAEGPAGAVILGKGFCRSAVFGGSAGTGLFCALVGHSCAAALLLAGRLTGDACGSDLFRTGHFLLLGA